MRRTARGRKLSNHVGTSALDVDRFAATARPGVNEARAVSQAPGEDLRFPSADSDEALRAAKAELDASRGAALSLPSAISRVGVQPRESAATLFAREIPRFRRSERALHWAIAIPFMVCLLSGLAVKLFFNHLHPQLLIHTALYWVHRLSGVCLLLLPTWVAWRHSHDLSLYLYNIKRAWTWTRDDFKWLALAGPAAISRRISLPEQHKFNAGEKLNFMALTMTYPVLVASGLVILLPGMYFLTWIVHVSVAVLAAPLIFGHVFMAVVNPDTRIGLSGMLSGNVDREWARHHYAKWYRENFGEDEAVRAALGEAAEGIDARALLRCPSCGAETCLVSWDAVLASVAELRPLDCPACGAAAPVVSAIVKPDEIGSFLEDLERAGARLPSGADTGSSGGTGLAAVSASPKALGRGGQLDPHPSPVTGWT